MHHEVLSVTVLGGAILCRIEVKLCRIIWFVIQSEHIVNIVDKLSLFVCCQRTESKEFKYTRRAFEHLQYHVLQEYFALFNPGFIPEK